MGCGTRDMRCTTRTVRLTMWCIDDKTTPDIDYKIAMPTWKISKCVPWYHLRKYVNVYSSVRHRSFSQTSVPAVVDVHVADVKANQRALHSESRRRSQLVQE